MVTAMIEYGVSALVISSAYGDEDATFGPLTRAGIPAVQVLRKVDARTDQFPFAAPDWRILAQDHPQVDAAICFNDPLALGVLRGFAERGRAVGPLFRLGGFDDIEECAQAYPVLSSVRCNIAGFGKSIAATMLDGLENGHAPATQTPTDVELVIRASSA